jgi:hypothetical protein
MLEKIKEQAAKEITPENADQELERVRKELEDGAKPSTTDAVKDESGKVEGAGTVPPVDGEKAGADGEKPADAPPAKDGETSGGE